MRTRTGKIARLPAEIRDQLNLRLADGARATDVLTWLNALPEVQKILTEQFAGYPICPQNLSKWRQGGYAEWAERRTGLAHWQNLLDHIDELSQQCTLADGSNVTSQLGTLVALELAQALDQLGQMKDSAKRWKIFRLLSLSLSRLRRDNCREQRLQLFGFSKEISGKVANPCGDSGQTSRFAPPFQKFLLRNSLVGSDASGMNRLTQTKSHQIKP